jgi:MFS family permease
MNVFDFFAVNIATPALHRELGSGPPALELIVGGYGLTFSLGLVTGGRLGDRYGRRRVFWGLRPACSSPFSRWRGRSAWPW